MNTRPEKGQSRREFLRSLARALAVGGLVGTGIWLGVRDRGRSAGDACINRGICRACRVVRDCRLPQAISFRAGTGGGA